MCGGKKDCPDKPLVRLLLYSRERGVNTWTALEKGRIWKFWMQAAEVLTDSVSASEALRPLVKIIRLQTEKSDRLTY
jgi:hypothetical protein